MSSIKREMIYGAKNLGRAVMGKPDLQPSQGGSGSRSSSSGGRSGGMDPHSFKFWWWYGSGKPQFHHRRRNVALVTSGIGIVLLALTWFNILPIGWGVLGVLLLGLMIAWAAFSGEMHQNPRKFIRKLSLEADHDFDDDIEHKIIFVDALINGRFIDDSVTPKDFVCFPQELDKPNPWKFKVRILFRRYTTSTLQSALEGVSLKIYNEDMPILDPKTGEEIDRGAYCQRVVVEPDPKGRAEWFVVLLYFDQEQTGYGNIGTPEEFRKFGGPGSNQPDRGGKPRRGEGSAPPRDEEENDDFAAFKDITNNKYGDARSSSERAKGRRS